MAVEVIAHRGASGYAPENTILAIQKAIDYGADYIEIDVQLTQDGHVIAIHDDTVDRTTSGKGKVRELNFSEIQILDAGSWFAPEFQSEKVPLLSEILDLDFKNSHLIIEVKNVNNINKGIENKIVELVRNYQLQDQIIYKSFSTEVLERFNNLDPGKKTLYVTIGPVFGLFVIDDWLRWGSLFDFKFVDMIQVHRLLISKSIIQKAHQRNLKIIAWDVHSPEDILKMKKLGVDLIETDFPDRVLNLN